MPYFIALLFVLIGSITAGHALILAFDYMVTGYGLVPWLAIPMGIYMLMWPIITFQWMVDFVTRIINREPLW